MKLFIILLSSTTNVPESKAVLPHCLLHQQSKSYSVLYRRWRKPAYNYIWEAGTRSPFFFFVILAQKNHLNSQVSLSKIKGNAVTNYQILPRNDQPAWSQWRRVENRGKCFLTSTGLLTPQLLFCMYDFMAVWQIFLENSERSTPALVKHKPKKCV